MPACFGQPTVATIIKQLDKSPPSDKLDLTNNARVQMKPAESMATLVEALRENNSVKTLVLRQCGLNDAAASEIGGLLEKNQVIEELDLEHNNISSSGAIAIANGLIKNHGIRQLNMLHQHGGCFGEVTLERFMEMLGKNITLTKIMWRLESRKSFALTKAISRNVEIWRRVGLGRGDYVDMLPDDLRADPPSVLTEKCAPRLLVATPRVTENDQDIDSGKNTGEKAVAAPEVSDKEKEQSSGETATGDVAKADACTPAAQTPTEDQVAGDAAPAESAPTAERPTEEPHPSSDAAPATAEETPAQTGEKLEVKEGGEEPPKDPVESPQQ